MFDDKSRLTLIIIGAQQATVTRQILGTGIRAKKLWLQRLQWGLCEAAAQTFFFSFTARTKNFLFKACCILTKNCDFSLMKVVFQFVITKTHNMVRLRQYSTNSTVYMNSGIGCRHCCQIPAKMSPNIKKFAF